MVPALSVLALVRVGTSVVVSFVLVSAMLVALLLFVDCSMGCSDKNRWGGMCLYSLLLTEAQKRKRAREREAQSEKERESKSKHKETNRRRLMHWTQKERW